MTATLSDANLLLGTLPHAFETPLAQLHALDLLLARTQKAGASDSDRSEAAAVRVGLVSAAAELADNLPDNLRPDAPSFQHGFAEAVLLWGSFADTGGERLIDTVGDGSFAGYSVDFRPTGAERERLRRALSRMYGYSVDELAAIERKLEHIGSNLRVKQAIAQALRDMVHDLGTGDERRGALALMRAIYGALPWRDGDVDLMLTTTSVFLCIPHADGALLRPDYGARPASERDAIADFLARVKTEQQSIKSVRFPAFGLFDESLMATDFLPRLLATVSSIDGMHGVNARVLVDTLRTMVTVLPTQELAKYLIHDAWGHGWQESLCEFEWTFADMPRLVEPLHMAGPTYGAHGERLADAFAAVSGRTTLQPEALLRMVEADVRGRIRVGTNLVISECLADLIEHKAARFGSPLPSSSLVPTCPLRIDLSLSDARSMVRAWRKPYRALSREADRARLTAELVALGLPDAGCGEAVAEACALIATHFAVAFDDGTEVVIAEGGDVRATVMQRILLGVAGFDAAVERFLDLADAHRAATAREGAPRYRCPVACIDLLALLLGWFYEQERALHVFHLDELLHDALLPALLELEVALED